MFQANEFQCNWIAQSSKNFKAILQIKSRTISANLNVSVLGKDNLE